MLRIIEKWGPKWVLSGWLSLERSDIEKQVSLETVARVILCSASWYRRVPPKSLYKSHVSPYSTNLKVWPDLCSILTHTCWEKSARNSVKQRRRLDKQERRLYTNCGALWSQICSLPPQSYWTFFGLTQCRMIVHFRKENRLIVYFQHIEHIWDGNGCRLWKKCDTLTSVND